MNVELVWATPDPEKMIIHMARVSNPKNQGNENIAGLVSYLIRSKHWSPFELANLCVEIKTSRAIAAQILRHRSFSFQEFSQRYATVTEFEWYPARLQAEKNRQSSLELETSDPINKWFAEAQMENNKRSVALYNEALSMGVAREQARFLLPMASATTMYMNGTIRSWIHYLELRTKEDVQKEHREIADAIKGIFIQLLPVTSSALGWCDI